MSLALLFFTAILGCQGMRICDPSYTVKVPGGIVQFVIVQVGDEKYEFTYDPAMGQTYVDCHDLAGYCAILGEGFGGALRETSIQPLAFDAAEIHVYYDHTVWLPIFQADP